MIYKLLSVAFVVAFVIVLTPPSYSQTVPGYELPPRPTYVILAPRKVRPGQVYQVSVSALRLIYKQLTIRISIKRDTYEYIHATETFTRPSTRIMQLKVPDTTIQGFTYWLHVQGSVLEKGGLLFDNRTKLEYEGKKVSIFIQMSKPMYHQGQVVRFRIIPIKPNLLPDYGTVTRVSVIDASNTTVRRWYDKMTNAGGVIELEFTLAKQVSEGKWKIQAQKDEFFYEKSFDVVEYWQRRFDVNVSMPRRISEYGFGIYGLIMANHTSGRPVKGNATINIEIRDPRKTMADPPVYNLTRYIPVFDGKSDFLITMDELKESMKGKQLANMEVYANVSVIDWFLLLEYSGYGYSFIYPHKTQIKMLGGRVRPFKPKMPFTLLMVVYQPDGTQVLSTTNRLIELIFFCDERRVDEKRLSVPDKGVVQYTFSPLEDCTYYRIRANYKEITTTIRRDGSKGQTSEQIINYDEQRIFKYYSSSGSFLQVTTSTFEPKINEYMIFNIRTTYYTPEIYYQIVAGGNIIFADKLDMPSNTLSKTFSVSLSRDMAPIARLIAFYIKQNGEIVSDSLTFFTNIERLNKVKVEFNRGKDFNVDTVEVNAYAEPGSYIAFSAIHYDLFIHGGASIFQEHDLTDELASYESHSQQPFNHTWFNDREVNERVYFPTPSFGADTNSTFNDSGLIIFTDANFTKVNFYHDCNETLDAARALPCYSYKGPLCFSRAQKCDTVYDCMTGYDELRCSEEVTDTPAPKDSLKVLNKLWRHFDDGNWMWKSMFVKPDGRVDFRVELPKIDTSWVVGAFAVERDSGFSIMNKPGIMSGVRRFFITVEMPEEAVWGEQIGVRIAVFNYWNYWIETLVEIKHSEDFEIVLVRWRGFVNSYSPDLAKNQTVQTLVYLEAGDSTYIHMPVIPRNKEKTVITICAYTFIGSNCETRSIKVRMNGVPNYYHTAMMLNLTQSSSMYITNFDIAVPQMFWEPEQRILRYVPESPRGSFAINGDVIGPGLSRTFKYGTTENVLRRPDDACENVLFEFGYNVELMLYLRSTNQFKDLVVQQNVFDYIYLLLQRLMSYFNHERGAFAEFREDLNATNPFLAAFGLYVFTEITPIQKEKEEVLYIPKEIMRKLVDYLKTQQAPDGSFTYKGVRDRKFFVEYPGFIAKTEKLKRVPVTAMVVMALGNKDLPSSFDQGAVKTRAVNFLNSVYKEITDPFSMSMVVYALLTAGESNTDPYKRLMKMSKIEQGHYWANAKIPRIIKRMNKAGTQIINPRLEWPNDGYATQATALALLSHYTTPGSGGTNVSTVIDWLQQMRNTDSGFASTQDTFWAVKALREVADADRDRSVYALQFELTLTSLSNFERKIEVQRDTLSIVHRTGIPNNHVWGEVQLKAVGTGHALLQLDVQKNVRENFQIKNPTIPFDSAGAPLVSFRASCDAYFSGRNASIMRMSACGTWVVPDLPYSGMTVFEIDLPTGYVVMNDELRRYAESRVVPSLRRAIYRPGKIHFYFDKMTRDEQTCVEFRADRWYPVANMTENYMCSLYEYYEPGRHNTTKYEAQSLFTNHICNVCGSYQCPYCPDYNIASVLKYSTVLILLCLFSALYGRRMILTLS